MEARDITLHAVQKKRALPGFLLAGEDWLTTDHKVFVRISWLEGLLVHRDSSVDLTSGGRRSIKS